MDVRSLYPEDIIREEDVLMKIFFSRPQDEYWEDFCQKYASKRYNTWMKKRKEEYEENLKKGYIIN